jgi:hypothetical protein
MDYATVLEDMKFLASCDHIDPTSRKFQNYGTIRIEILNGVFEVWSRTLNIYLSSRSAYEVAQYVCDSYMQAIKELYV